MGNVDTKQISQASIQDQFQLEAILKSLQSGGLDAKYGKVASVALTAGSANAFAFAWQNPEDAKILVHKLMIDVTTAGGSATSVLNAGAAANATTTADDLIDGADANAAAVYDNIDSQGTNGTSNVKLDEKGGTTDYVTCQILVANAANLAGYAYIYYTEVAA